jgi:WD40 repeat protein
MPLELLLRTAAVYQPNRSLEELRLEKGGAEKPVWVALSADARIAISKTRDSPMLSWDAQNCRVLREIGGRHGDEIHISEKGKRALVGQFGGDPQLWEIETSKHIRTFCPRMDTTSWSVSLSGDGRRVAYADSDTVIVWDAETGRPFPLLKGHTGEVTAVRLSHDGSTLLSAAHGDRSLILWEVARGCISKKLEGLSDTVYAMYLDSRYWLAVTGAADGVVALWDLERGRTLLQTGVHADKVTGVSISAYGQRILSCSDDKTVRLSSAKADRPPDTLTLDSPPVSLAMAGKRAVIGDESGGIAFLEIAN